MRLFRKIRNEETRDWLIARPPVAAFSPGKDGIPGGKGYEGKFLKPASTEPPDDIASWQ